MMINSKGVFWAFIVTVMATEPLASPYGLGRIHFRGRKVNDPLVRWKRPRNGRKGKYLSQQNGDRSTVSRRRLEVWVDGHCTFPRSLTHYLYSLTHSAGRHYLPPSHAALVDRGEPALSAVANLAATTLR